MPFVVDAVSYAVSVVTLLFVRTPFRVEPRSEREPFRREIQEGLRWLWRTPFLRACSIMIAGSNFVFQGVFLAIVVVARGRGATSIEIAAIFLIQALGGLSGALAAPRLRRRLPTRGIVIGVNWVWAAILPLMALPVPPIALGPLFGLMTFAGPTWNVVIGTYQLTMIPDRLLGRVQSVDMLLSWGAIPLGSVVAGVILERLTATHAMLGFSAMMLAIAAIATLSPSLRRPPPFPDEAVDPSRAAAAAGGPTAEGPPGGSASAS
jgi:Na+/melibiose symporter-like transporter